MFLREGKESLVVVSSVLGRKSSEQVSKQKSRVAEQFKPTKLSLEVH